MDKISTLWHGASYQEHLLQSYRNFHLTTQSIFVAIGVGITIAMVSINGLKEQLLIYAILVLITSLGVYLLKKMRKLIVARGEDVDHYHKAIIEFEKSLPKEERVLTDFKVYQKFNRQETNIKNYFQHYELAEDEINQLTEKGKGHTRKLLDRNLFIWFYLIWLGFHLVGLFILIESLLKNAS